MFRRRLAGGATAAALCFTVVPALADEPVPGSADCSRIGTVRVDRLDVFDTDRPDEDNPAFRLVNFLHIQTRESVIRKRLLFKPGDAYDARLLEESERLLRSTGHLRSATVQAGACHDGVVDVEVLTQDVWTLKPGLSFGRQGGKNSTSLGLEESNLLGFGSRLGLVLQSGVDRDTRMLYYRDPQLNDARWALSTQYASNSDGKSQLHTLERPFYALDTRWAAGATLRRETRIDSTYEQGRITGQYQTEEHFYKLYGGLSEGLRNGWVTRWSAGWTDDFHDATPIVSAGLPSTGQPSHRDLVYPWLGFELLEDAYRKTQNQDQIGRTEDVTLGWHVTAMLGAASPRFGADRSAAVFNARVSRGIEPTRDQTLLLDASTAGRWERDGLAGTLVSASARYYLRLSPRRSVYVTLATDRAINPDSDQQVLLGGDSGLRGYPLRYQSGKGRWLFTAEERWFTDWFLFRLFNVGGAVFYDMGRTWDSETSAQAPQGLLRDLGFGLRLGNSRSSLGNVLHIDLAFPLDGDANIRRVQFLVEAKRSF